jgi:2TM domain-containing protein
MEMIELDKTTEPDPLRARALARLQKKREFWQHVMVFVTINTVFTAIWALMGADGFFWPIFPMLGWGMGIFFHAWDVYSRGPSEEQIQREINRMR